MGANLNLVSVSGISSGGFMAAQLATAYSSVFMGVGVIAAGPYFCAGTYPELNYLGNATTTCMTPAIAAVAADAGISWANARRFAQAGFIDPVSNLARQKVYVFSGSNDTTVKTMVVDAVPKYYALAHVPAANIVYDKTTKAGHSIVTAKPSDVACPVTAPPYINDCDFTQSQVLLKHIYGPAVQKPSPSATQGITRFNQGEFFSSERASMDADAYVYIPAVCQRSACGVHVAFHGCEQGASVIGDRFYNGTGYNEFADTNKLIILYPQAHPSSGIPANPKGCWDFWGYSSDDQNNPNFYTRNAPQMKAIAAMIQRLGQPRSVLASATSQ
ncbi:extracellular catalytic domain type 2 short-chain-length polyhydroxyalkanoate depolymerase [Duganella guangzhouensis]|uniref:extracellular catalytic domain type 2 short-chain-length polyhydroxyalkanoate depolymerase n=1 Tax=Duganella guangzhouensis TaxID=2666084 RepID=UPI0018A211BC|nr:poly(3-hydroxybutyrate) depolymerase [Duganella guangzhouensis]